MDLENDQSLLWQLAVKQRGVVSRCQLLAAGLSAHAITHRLRTGRLHLVWPRVYAVGRPELSYPGRLQAALLTCGSWAVLSHETAAGLWRIRPQVEVIHVSVPAERSPRRKGIRLHRRTLAPEEITEAHGLPLTTPEKTIVDIATRLGRDPVEGAINDADKLDLIDPESLRRSLEGQQGRRGVAVVRSLLDWQTFTLTDSALERRFLPLARRAGLPRPQTQKLVAGLRADFFWPDLGLVVETDGLRYHRTPSQQAKDHRRDQIYFAAGFTPLRFSHAQITFEPASVVAILRRAIERLID